MAEKKYVIKKNAAFPSGVAYPSMSDKFSNRDYTNTFADQAAEESGLDTVDDYPIFNDIEFQVDAEKTIKNNFLSQVGLRAAMKKTGGDLSKLLQNYLATDTKEDLNKPLQPRHMKPQYEGDNRTPDQRWQDEQDNRMGTLSATDTPSKTKEGPYDYNTTFVNDPSNPDFVLNPKIRIKLSELADSDSAIQTQWREVQNDPNATAIDQYGMSRLDANRNQMTNLEYMKSLIPENQTPMSQANVINHELNHFAIIELYNTGRLSKKILTLLRNNDGNEMAKIEHDIIDQMTRRDLPEDPTFKGKIKPPVVNETDNTKALDKAAKLWLKDNSPPVREYDSSGVLKAEEPKFKEEMYDGAIPAGLAKGGDIMPMEQQMQMFAIGGLDDDGLSRDPVSGNEIPPGSMANEVRDDVEARLSDGEYVVPANVVRFFGVKFFEDLRTQAMQGLGAMEANGRIGGEPVPSAMPMQDQMAEIQPDVSEEEMQMLQGLMNEGGYVSGYANGGDVPKDIDLENPSNYPFNPSPFLTPGGTYVTSENLTPDPNAPAPTPVDPGPNPESGISFVTMVNPATGAIQVVQFMGGNPVDEAAYNELITNGFFIQGGAKLAAYKQKEAQDNRESDKQMGGDKPKSVNDLLSGDLYGDMSLGLGAKLAGSVLNKAFPTKSNQQVLDYIIDNRDPVTGKSRFPPSGRGIPLRDANNNIVYNAGGTPKFQTDKNGFILRAEGKDEPRNVAKEEVARILDIMNIKKANTNSKGVLKNRAYRDALKKAGHAKGVGLTTKFVNPADWYKSDAGIAAIKALGTPTTTSKSTTADGGSSGGSGPSSVITPTYGDVSTPEALAASEAAGKAFTTSAEAKSKAGFMNEGNDNNNNNNDNDNRPVGSTGTSAVEANVSGPTGENVSDQDKEVKDIKDYGYREDAGYGLMNKGGIVKKPKKKKTKKY